MLYAIVVVLVLIADQLMKYWVTANITLNSGSVELIPGILKLVNIHNDGAAFSLFPGYRWIFVGLAAAVTIAVILALIFKWIKSGFGRWMAVLTMAGALGNAIDRAIYGYVVDMFVIEPVKFIQVFNVADIFITVGGILFCLYLIISGGRYQVKRVTGTDAETKAPAEEPEEAAGDPEVPEEEPVGVAEEAADEEEPADDDTEPDPEKEPKEEDTSDEETSPEEEEEEDTSEEYSLSDSEEPEEEDGSEEPEEEDLPNEEEFSPEETESEEEPSEDTAEEEPEESVSDEEEELEEPEQMELDLDPESAPAEDVPEEEPAAEEIEEEEPEIEAEISAEPEEEFSFSLEDILNEFR